MAQTYGFWWGYEAAASILYLVAGLGLAVLPMRREQVANAPDRRWSYPAAWSLLFLLILWCIWRTPQLFSAAPLDYRQADMLPVIRTMAQRWWAAEPVYAPIDDIWGGMRPIYLPAMWIPFTAGILFQVDIRWVSATLLLLGLVLIFFGPTKKKQLKAGFLALLGMLPIILLCIFIFDHSPTLLTLSEEPVVVFYYLLLAWGLFRRRPWLTGMAIALCLLSRYSLAFWVPMYLIYQFFYRSRSAAFTTLGVMVISLLVLLTIGQAWDQLTFFLHLQDSYLQELLKAESRWAFVDKIEHNPGLVKFLPYDYISIWHQLLIYGSILVPVLSILLYKKYRHLIDDRFFGICSLKLAMVYFCNMLTIPYSYLFYPSTFLSLFILYASFSAEKRLE